MKEAVTVVPRAVVNVPAAVAVVGKGAAHGSFRWIALTNTMRVSASIDPMGKRLAILSAVCALTQSLMASLAGSGRARKSSR